MGGAATTDHEAREQVRVVGRGEQRSGSPDVRPDDVRPTEVCLRHEPRQEVAHGAWCQQVVVAFRATETGQVDAEQAGVRRECLPHASEGVEALGPRAGEQDRGPVAAAAVGVPDPNPVNRSVVRPVVVIAGSSGRSER